MAVEAAANTEGPGLPTPPAVLECLTKAFGADKMGETGYEIAGAKCTSEVEKEEARKRGSSLLYGELLPDGVSKALHHTRLGGALSHAGGVALELGMGSGKVATQIFLQCPTVQQLVGVELVHSRYSIAEVALQRLAETFPKHFQVSTHHPGTAISLVEVATGRKAEFHCQDFFVKGLDLCNRSDMIIFAVSIPCKLFPQLCQQLAKAKTGCRLFTYHALDSIWWIDEPCPFIQCDINTPESDTFATSWSPQGYKFYVYTCDRSRAPQIGVGAGARNDTFSEWQPIWDEAAGAYYYHNQETEHSQWEVPHHAGCWQAEWSAEHQAYFFWHTPTGFSQWEVPRCLADLGWAVPQGTSSALPGGSG